VAVIRLGASCELEGETSNRADFRVSEYAVLDDGSEIVLCSERGYSAGINDGEHADVWKHMTAAGIESDVRAVVGPDDDNETGEDHRWDRIVGLLARAGVTESADRLRDVPYEVRLGPSVVTRLPPRS
jgi:hypothetical protein